MSHYHDFLDSMPAVFAPTISMQTWLCGQKKIYILREYILIMSFWVDKTSGVKQIFDNNILPELQGKVFLPLSERICPTSKSTNKFVEDLKKVISLKATVNLNAFLVLPKTCGIFECGRVV